MAVVEGLREVMCVRGEHALPLERATAALDLFLERLPLGGAPPQP